MKKIIYILAILFYNYTYSQTNLVPNPSFETYTTCPTTLDQTSLAVGWSSYGGSPDYFNSCNTSGLGVPSNGIGYQVAATGFAYGGFIAYDINGQVREIIGTQLNQPLSTGQTYYISFKVSLSEFDAFNKQFVPCNKIGIRFSTIQYSDSSPAPTDNLAHIFTNSKISDTLNWTTISGSFTADANYQYLMIGNFFDDANTDTTYRINGIRSYFFVDDVCVSTSSISCFETTGLKNIQISDGINVYVDQNNSILKIETTVDDKYTLNIHDSFGNAVIENHEPISSLDVSKFANGIYFVTLLRDKKRRTQKIIINH